MTKYSGTGKILRAMLVADEGNSPGMYVCPSGKVTIGIGHNLTDNGLTQEQIDKIYDDDVSKATDGAIRVLGAGNFSRLSPERRCVVVSMVFQLGESGFAKFHKTIDAIKKGEFTEAANEMLSSLWAQQTPKRAQRLAGMMRTSETDRFYFPFLSAL